MSLQSAVDLALSKLTHKTHPREGKKGRDVQANCPFHTSQSKKSFGLNIDTGEWNCWGGCGGGWIDHLLERLGVPSDVIKSHLGGVPRPKKGSKHRHKVSSDGLEMVPLPEDVISILHRCPVTMLDAGWDMSLLEEFEIGLDLDKDRVTYPIRGWNEELLAVSGRTIYDIISPPYLFYQQDDLFELAPPNYRCDRRFLLYNVQRAKSVQAGELVPICEGFKEVLRLHEAGFTAVALTGAMFSSEQVELLNRLYQSTRCTFVLFLDNDEVGMRQAKKLGMQLMRFCKPKITFTEEKKDASEVDIETAKETVLKAQPFFIWLIKERNVGERNGKTP